MRKFDYSFLQWQLETVAFEHIDFRERGILCLHEMMMYIWRLVAV